MTAVRKPIAVEEGVADAALLERICAGDREALGVLYDRHAQHVYAYVRRIAPRDEAEDIVQITFVRIAEVAAGFDHRTLGARAWVFGVAHRVVSERRRAWRRLADALSRYGEVLRAEGSRRGDDALAGDLERALATLAPAKREVLLLTKMHGFSAEEVATMLDIPVGTVWTRLHHARRELGKLLGGAQ